MRKALVLAGILIAAVVVSGCTQTGQVINADTGPVDSVNDATAPSCPSWCSDGNKCTQDTCGEETGFKCVHTPLASEACGEG
jgi:hypothetical protein